MHLPTYFTAFAALALTTLAAPTMPTELMSPMEPNSTTSGLPDSPSVYITNHCPFSLYVTSVGKDGPMRPITELTSGSRWIESQYFSGVGTAIKLTRTKEGLYNGAPVLILGYTLNPGVSIYYDLGLHAGNPLTGYNVRLSGAGGDNFWNPDPKPQATRGYWGTTDLNLDTCL